MNIDIKSYNVLPKLPKYKHRITLADGSVHQLVKVPHPEPNNVSVEVCHNCSMRGTGCSQGLETNLCDIFNNPVGTHYELVND